jgi:D-alanine-D-alanine ligase
MAKLRVGLLFGGRSVEHEVSIASATSILKALDPSRYDVELIAVDHAGHWRLGTPALPPERAVAGEEIVLPAAPGLRSLLARQGSSTRERAGVDVIFPIIHGRGGEDGSVQGLFELAEVPYVGSGVLGSALQMDKEVAKRLLAAAGLPVTPWRAYHSRELPLSTSAMSDLKRSLRLPVFAKPANSGSSVGISKVERWEDLPKALAKAARFDHKLLVEQGVDAREIEVALLGSGDRIEASVVGEIRTQHAFYDYEAKYVDESTELFVPAPLDEATSDRARELAVRAMQVLEGEGLGRVDFLLERNTGEIFVNELNSLPGFTESSMYPRLWAATGVPYPALLDRLIELALDRHRRRAALETLYKGD